jgi:hypothetical protein
VAFRNPLRDDAAAEGRRGVAHTRDFQVWSLQIGAVNFMTIKYDVPASLHRWETVEKKRAGDAESLGDKVVWDGTLAGCVKQFLSKRKAEQRALFEIMVGDEAGVGKTILGSEDILAIAARNDFPKD